MKKREELKKGADDPIKWKLLLNSSEPGVIALLGNRFKKVLIISSLAGMGLFLNSCFPGFVTAEPAYVEFARPPRPSNVHIWIDGDWYWNNRTHVYVQKTGYWQKPYQSQVYVTGHWQTTPKGKSWTNGHWQRENRKDDNRRK
jgi:hypothetical protein